MSGGRECERVNSGRGGGGGGECGRHNRLLVKVKKKVKHVSVRHKAVKLQIKKKKSIRCQPINLAPPPTPHLHPLS